jgi:IS5 family transposase
MLKKQIKNDNSDLYNQKLEYLINLKHPLCVISNLIPWHEFESEFEKYYKKDFGRPAKPIRLMVSLLILKRIYDESDESVIERWRENPYWQYYSGEEFFSWNLPCDSSELTRFRQRIGEEGCEKILQVSIKVHGKDGEEKEVIPDTTVQEKNITYPVDTKLHLKIINKCWKIAEKFRINLRQSYKRTVPKLRFSTRYLRIPKRKQEARKAILKIKTIAGRLLRDLNRKLPTDVKNQQQSQLAIMQKVLEQQRTSKNKIYSLHEPEVSCIAKGKEHKKYEFGSKASVLITKKSGVVVAAKNFKGNPYDGNTLEPTLEQSERLRGIKADKALVDEGYRGKSEINGTEILRVHQANKIKYSKYKWKNWFRRRSSVEAVIGHLKNNHRLCRNYLKGTQGDSMNLLLSAAGYNFRKLLIKIALFFVRINLGFLLTKNIKTSKKVQKFFDVYHRAA